MSGDDSWRFAEEAARRQTKELGAYGGEVVPGVAVRSVTGITRGEELYCRPELHRPWRTPSAQRHAEAIVTKEQEIEALTRKCTDFRNQVAVANREIQRLQASSKVDLTKLQGDKDTEIAKLKNEIVELNNQLSQQKTNHDHQLRILRTQLEAEVSRAQAKAKSAVDSLNDMSNAYARQIDDVKAAAVREVELIQQLCNARTAELTNDLQAATEALQKTQTRTAASLGEMQAEMRRSEQRCFDQLKEQERRFEAMRGSLQSERQVVEVQRDKATTEQAGVQEKSKSLSLDLVETETRFKDWNQRILSDLDQLFEYYSAMIREVEENSVPVVSNTPQVSEVYIPPRLSGEQLQRVTMDRIAERLQQLTLMKQQHSRATMALQRKIRDLEANADNQSQLQQRGSQEKDLQLSRMLSEVIEARARQDRLQAAFTEMQEKFVDVEARLSSALVRLQFFNEDLSQALQNPAASVAPPVKDVTFVLLCVDGAAMLWEYDTNAAQSATMLLNSTVRSKLAQYGAYECFSDGATMMIAFHDPAAACRFCIETQLWLMEAPWPPSILAHHNTAETYEQDERGNRFLVFRGLRVGMAIHSGEVEMEPTGLPVGIGEGRVHYFGRTVILALHLASMALGGQIIVSGPVWEKVKGAANDLGGHVMSDLGDHRLTVASRDSPNSTTTEVMALVQLLPTQLQARNFSRQAMFDARKHLQAGDTPAASPALSHLRRSILADEVTALRNRKTAISKAVETLSDEVAAVTKLVEALRLKVKDAQMNNRTFSAAEIASQSASIDRLVTRSDTMRTDITRVIAAEKEVTAQIKTLDDTLQQHSRITMTEDDFRRRIDIANERCNERIFENNMQNEHKLQQLKNALAKSEQSNQQLLQRLSSSSTQQQPLAHDSKPLADTTNHAKSGGFAEHSTTKPPTGGRPPSSTRSRPASSDAKPVRAEIAKGGVSAPRRAH